jgi:peptide/nickel transport system permease protein
MVLRRLRENRLARFGLACIWVLFVLATCAPLVSFNQPLLWDAGDGLRFPWFAGLFNRLLFESTVDILFNLVLVSSLPVFGVCWAVRRHRPRTWARHRGRVLLGLCAALALSVLLFAPRRPFGLDNPLYFSERVENYPQLEQELRSAGQAVFSVFPLRPFGYRDTAPERSLRPPSAEHWLGTDTEGRDVMARMLYGARISLTIGVVAVFIYVSIGIVLGALAGYFGGWIDLVISRLIEVMICFPSFFLILTIAALIEERSIFHVMVIIGLTSWTGVARLIRAEFLKNRELEYVLAARALGIPRLRIIFRHILPNAIAPVLVTATFGVATAVLIESSLAFLGIGDLTVASWGETLNTGRLQGKLWLVLAPGAAIFFVVSIFNLVGEGLRDALDPKLNS